MVIQLVKKISRGSKFNQIYLQKNEMGFEVGKSVIISPLDEAINEDVSVFGYNVKLNSLKKEIVRRIFRIISDNCSCENIIITGSFLEEGFNFEDIDIIVLSPKNAEKSKLNDLISESIGIIPHLILIDAESFNKGISQDPLFRLMIGRYCSIKRAIFSRDMKINYKLLDIYLLKSKDLIEGYDLLNIRQRKKLLRDFISIKAFAEGKEITLGCIAKETNKIFGKDIIEKLFYYGDCIAKSMFIRKFKEEFRKLESKILENASKQNRPD